MSAEKKNLSRRDFIKTSTLIAVAVSVPGLESCSSDDVESIKNGCTTTADILGPFYKASAPFREDIIPYGNTAAPLFISGKVSSGCDTGLPGAIVEIWNADVDGAYDTSEDFKFRGRFETGQDGMYRFKTIIPGRYLNGATFRPSHIHFRITAPDHQELVSQIYFKDDPFIDSDPWAGDPNAAKRILTTGKDANGNDTVTFDIYLTPLM